jgi:hypothetical protein
MINNSANRQVIDPHPITPVNEKQGPERRRLQDALEDDEVYEALTSLHAPKETKATFSQGNCVDQFRQD